MNDNGYGGIRMTGFFVGALVGAAVALLYAPCSGQETREWLSKRTRDLRNKTQEALDETKDKARSFVNEAARELPRGRA